ncbi:ABC transporter substrate-binding protein [Methylobacterium tarhaniae]|uniref:ABC transporter substrate-binding protein n=1 Tax=Methylobacterium tarhaniae TaxID=1187852 RepID=UPI003D058D13
MRIGVHPNNIHLALAERWPGALASLDPVFVPYAEGRDSAALLRDGTIDLCGTGSTPPIAAEAAGLDVAYVAASSPRPANGGILVAPDGRARAVAIRSVADLRGRRVALIDGSFHTYLLAKVLEGVGLSLSDVVRVELSPGASLRALDDGEVDAWVAMAPLLDQALAAGRAHLLAPCGATIPNRSVFWTLGERGLSGRDVAQIAAALAAFGDAIGAAPDRAADLLAEGRLAGVDRAAWRRAIGSRDWRIVPADAGLLAEQQAEADTLARHGALPHPVRLSGRIGPTPAPGAAA